MTLLGGAYLYGYCAGVPPPPSGEEGSDRIPKYLNQWYPVVYTLPKIKNAVYFSFFNHKIMGLINSWLGANWLGPYQLGVK